MSKASTGHTMPEVRQAISRRSILNASVVVGSSAALSLTAPAVADEAPEWPEFRRWYDLVLEEEELYEQSLTDDEREERLKTIWDKSNNLEDSMLGRESASAVNAVIPSLVALRWADKKTSTNGNRLLELGTNCDLTAEGGMERAAAAAIDASIRQAVKSKTLPQGVKIYGLGGNA